MRDGSLAPVLLLARGQGVNAIGKECVMEDPETQGNSGVGFGVNAIGKECVMEVAWFQRVNNPLSWRQRDQKGMRVGRRRSPKSKGIRVGRRRRSSRRNKK